VKQTKNNHHFYSKMLKMSIQMNQMKKISMKTNTHLDLIKVINIIYRKNTLLHLTKSTKKM
jgi:hypothetical protein